MWCAAGTRGVSCHGGMIRLIFSTVCRYFSCCVVFISPAVRVVRQVIVNAAREYVFLQIRRLLARAMILQRVRLGPRDRLPQVSLNVPA